jgi:hypothetical protein
MDMYTSLNIGKLLVVLQQSRLTVKVVALELAGNRCLLVPMLIKGYYVFALSRQSV